MDLSLLYFEQEHRQHKWWWGNMEDQDALVDMVALDFGPRIFAGGIATRNYAVQESPQCSQVFKHDEHGVPTWYVLAVELRGASYDDVYFDLMVHADTKMMEILLFACKLFGKSQDNSSVMFVWGLDENCEIDADDPNSCFAFSSENPCAFVHKRFADVFVAMQEVAARMQKYLLEEQTGDFVEPREKWETILRMQVRLWD